MKMIGLRRMAVIMWCAANITAIMLFHVSYGVVLGASEIAGITLIAGLGGFHSYSKGSKP